MGILEKIKEKRFIAFFMLLICLLTLVLPQTAQAASAYDVVLPVEQVFTKPDGSQAADTFTYTLTAQESGSPMPAGSSQDTYHFNISGTDTVNLEAITYSTAGTYHYELKQKVDTEQTGYTYDLQVYKIRVDVINTDDGLKAYVIGLKEDGYKVSAIEFVNAYAPLSSTDITGSTKGVKTGDNVKIELYQVMLLISVVLLVCAKRHRKG